MPKAADRALQAEARRKFPRDVARQHAYVYGALRRQGWVPHRERPALPMVEPAGESA